MDKTISINIGGVVFHITEEAHDLLQNYFETLRKHFVNQEGSDEIMGDIEARVAEMFTDRLKKEGTQVITNSQVSNMIDIMGLPEDFDADVYEGKPFSEKTTGYTSAAAAFTSSSSSRQQAKRLFRNEDDKKIGGVCSGISAYFGIADPLWLRLIVLLLFFLSGGGVFLIYIVLLVVIPPARTAADKLAMRGESINIANIEKTVKDNWSDIQNNLNANQAGSAVRRVGNIITDIVQIIAALIIKLIKWLSGFTGIVLAFTLFVLLMASIIGGMISFNFLKNYIIDSPFMLIVGWISLLLVVFLPLIWLALLLARWIFNFDFSNRKKIWLGMGIAWLFALLGAGWVGTSIANQYRHSASFEESTPLSIAGNTLHLKSDSHQPYEDIEDRMKNLKMGDWAADGDLIMSDDVRIDIEKSDNGRLELHKVYTSRGATRKDAREIASRIVHQYEVQDSVITIKPYFTVHPTDKIKGQSVRLVLRVPEGTTLIFDENMGNMLYDIDNVSNTYDWEMANKTWTMQKEGLVCTANCKGITVDNNNNNNTDNNSGTISGGGRVEDFKDFDEVELSGFYDVNIERADEYSVIIQGEGKKDVEISQSGSTLLINKDKNDWSINFDWDNFDWKSRSATKIIIRMPHLKSLETSGATVSRVKGFEEEDIAFHFTGASESTIEVSSNNLDVNVSGAANIELHGMVNKADYDLSGACKLKAYDLKAKTVSVDASGACSAQVYAEESINADASGPSSIRYRGGAQDVKKDAALPATIEAD